MFIKDVKNRNWVLFPKQLLNRVQLDYLKDNKYSPHQETAALLGKLLHARAQQRDDAAQKLVAKAKRQPFRSTFDPYSLEKDVCDGDAAAVLLALGQHLFVPPIKRTEEQED